MGAGGARPGPWERRARWLAALDRGRPGIARALDHALLTLGFAVIYLVMVLVPAWSLHRPPDWATPSAPIVGGYVGSTAFLLWRWRRALRGSRYGSGR